MNFIQHTGCYIAYPCVQVQRCTLVRICWNAPPHAHTLIEVAQGSCVVHYTCMQGVDGVFCVLCCVYPRMQGVLFLDASIHKEEANPHDRMREFLHYEVGHSQ